LDGYKYHRRARRPRLSHGNLDWQPNDHLGRSWSRPHLFEHRRQILRGCTKSDAYSDGDRDSNGYIYAYTNSYVHSHAYGNIDTYVHSHADSDGYSNIDFHSNCHSNGNTYAYRHSHIHTDFNGDSNSYTYFDTETFTDAEIRANAQAACHAATAPVALASVEVPAENGRHRLAIESRRVIATQPSAQTIDQVPVKSGAKTPRTPKALRAKCST
jgi:hypothetical protein